MFSDFDKLQTLLGKTIDRIDRAEHDEWTLVEFTDGTMWLLCASRHNAAGAILEHKVDSKHPHKK